MLIVTLLTYICSFIAIWLGTGLIVGSVDGLARKLKLSSFAVSFFILGLLTSIPETFVSYNAVANRNPEIFVGTLLGGIIVIFLFIIPVLAILGRGIRINHDLSTKNLLFALAVIAAPPSDVMLPPELAEIGVIPVIEAVVNEGIFGLSGNSPLRQRTE